MKPKIEVITDTGNLNYVRVTAIVTRDYLKQMKEDIKEKKE